MSSSPLRSNSDVAPTSQTATAVKTKAKPPWLWNVVLLDDQEHSYDYVIKMMQELFACTPQRAYEIAKRVDAQGRAVCATVHKELAELKREQILAFGRDPTMAVSTGPMGAVIEPAQHDDDAPGNTDKPAA